MIDTASYTLSFNIKGVEYEIDVDTQGHKPSIGDHINFISKPTISIDFEEKRLEVCRLVISDVGETTTVLICEHTNAETNDTYCFDGVHLVDSESLVFPQTRTYNRAHLRLAYKCWFCFEGALHYVVPVYKEA